MKNIIVICVMMLFGLSVVAQDDDFTLNGKADPTAALSGYYNICLGQTATIPVYLTNGPIWDVTFSDGITQWTVTGINSSPYYLMVSPPSVRTYTVVEVVAGGCYGTGSGAATVVIQPQPQIYSISCSNTVFCQGGFSAPIDVNGTTAGEFYHLVWENVDTVNTILGTGAPISFPGQGVAGNYQVVAENTTGCTSVMNGTVTLTMNPLPNPAGTITGPTSVCQNETGTYTTGTVVNATGYTWAVPTGATILTGQGTTMITVGFTGAASGNISVFPTNACGTGLASQFPVTVNAAPNLMVTTTASDICEGNSSTLTASGGNSYLWSNGATTASTIVMPAANTTYVVTATSTNGCTATQNVTINVHPLPNVSLVLSPSSACTNENIITLSGGYPAGGIYSGSCVIGTNTVYPGITGSGNYIITYTVTDSWGCQGTAQANFPIYNAPTVSFGPIDAGGPINVSTPPFMLTTGNPSGGVYDGPGVSMIGTNYWLDPAAAGMGTHMYTYDYTHPVTGCTGGNAVWLNVGNVGIEDVQNAVENISIFPNPVTDVVRLTGINTQEIKEIHITTVIGQTVMSLPIESENMDVNLDNLTSGVYMISFISADGLSVTKRIVKE